MQLDRVQHADQNIVEFLLQRQAQPWVTLHRLAAAVGAVGTISAGLLAAGASPGMQAALLSLLAAAVMANTLLEVTSEAVVVLRGVGVLLRSRRRCGAYSSSRFIDRQDIHSVIINETLTTTNIHVHLAFLLYDSSSLAVAFPSLSPGLKVLVPLYRELHALLHQ